MIYIIICMSGFLDGLDHMTMGTRLKRAGALMQAETQGWLESMGHAVPAGHLPILVALDATGPAAPGQLVEMMNIAQPGVSRMLRQLETAGLVATEETGSDRRMRTVSLTRAGRALIADMRGSLWPRINAAVREVCAGLEGGFRDQLAGLEQRLEDGTYRQALEGALEEALEETEGR